MGRWASLGGPNCPMSNHIAAGDSSRNRLQHTQHIHGEEELAAVADERRDAARHGQSVVNKGGRSV